MRQRFAYLNWRNKNATTEFTVLNGGHGFSKIKAAMLDAVLIDEAVGRGPAVAPSYALVTHLLSLA